MGALWVPAAPLVDDGAVGAAVASATAALAAMGALWVPAAPLVDDGAVRASVASAAAALAALGLRPAF